MATFPDTPHVTLPAGGTGGAPATVIRPGAAA